MESPEELVLIHGWGFGSCVWQQFIPCLQDRWRITLVNLPGYGEAGETASADIVKTANAVEQTIPENAILLAWSLGGLIAIRLAGIRNDIKAIVLVAGSPCFLKKGDWQHGIEPFDFDQLCSELNEDRIKALQSFSGLVALGDKDPRQTIRNLTSYIDKRVPDTETLRRGLDLLKEEDLRQDLASSDCPMGIIYGQKDVLVKHSGGKSIQAFRPDIKMIEIADTGHAPFLARPQATADGFMKLIADIL